MICAACNHPEIDHHGLECLQVGCDCRGFESACTPFCGFFHALNCPNYDGPISPTGTLSRERDEYGGTW